MTQKERGEKLGMRKAEGDWSRRRGIARTVLTVFKQGSVPIRSDE